jgi:hypothetical protein
MGALMYKYGWPWVCSCFDEFAASTHGQIPATETLP